MKYFKFILFTAFLLICQFATAQNANSQSLGVVSRLAEIKYGTESFFNSVMVNDDVADDSKREITICYNAIRTHMNRIIYQLMADMRVKNRLGIYRKINRHYKKHGFNPSNAGKATYYIAALGDLEKEYLEFIDTAIKVKEERGELKMLNLADLSLVEVVTAGWAILKEGSELRETKITNVASILESLMIDPVVAKSKE